MTKIYKLVFITVVFSGTMISISSYTWLGMWLGLEINLLAVIPLLQNNNNTLSSEASVKYFIVQAIASTIILASMIVMMAKTTVPSSINLNSATFLSMNTALLTKMGTAPFHFWFPEVMEGLSWMNCLIILTWQKIAPMVLLMYNMKFSMYMILVILISMVVSGIMGFNQVSLRKILAYSSINHMGWMISSMMVMETVWLVYFTVYSLTTINLILICNKLKTFYLSQLYQAMNENEMTKLWFMVNFLSLSGVPPLLGFLPKWLTIQVLVSNGMIILPVVMILLTMMMIYVYMRVLMSSLLMNIDSTSWTRLMPKFNKKFAATINFMSISSLAIVTLMINMN